MMIICSTSLNGYRNNNYTDQLPSESWLRLSMPGKLSADDKYFSFFILFSGFDIITKTRLFKYIDSFTTKKKTESFQIKILIFFHISAQYIDCGYSLEPPR